MDTCRDNWMPAYGVISTRRCANSSHLLEFRLGGVDAPIGSMRTLRSTLMSYRRMPISSASVAKSFSGFATGKRKKTEERIDSPALTAASAKESCTSLDAIWSDVPAVADERFIAIVPTTDVWISPSLFCDCPSDQRLIDEPRTQT